MSDLSVLFYDLFIDFFCVCVKNYFDRLNRSTYLMLFYILDTVALLGIVLGSVGVVPDIFQGLTLGECALFYLTFSDF